ncbi:MAG: hypothetical protein ACOX16_03000 [Candidatus Izemoplasmatales bacterium]|jgi:hypothetical protein
MIIEIYADNLRPKDVKFNQLFYAVSLIVVKEGRVLLLHDPKNNTYLFPRIAYYREPDRDLALASLANSLKVEISAAIKSVSLHEHFPKRSYVCHYYKIEIVDKEQPMLSSVSSLAYVWQKDYDALEILGDYHGDEPWGSQKMERDFIALINSI